MSPSDQTPAPAATPRQPGEPSFLEIFNATGDALTLHDRAGRILYANDRMCELFGCDAASVQGLSIDDLSLGERPYSQRDAAERIRLAVDEGPQLFEWRSKRRDGSLFWSEIALRTAAFGGELRLVASVRDITRLRQAEEDHRHLADSQRQAQTMESIGRLAGGVAHDFNNLLTSIGGNVALALQEFKPHDPLHELLCDVSRAVDAASNLTRQLLAVSRRQDSTPRALDLNGVVSRLQKMLQRLLGEEVELKTVLGDRVGPVRLDPAQLEQILVNLAINARDTIAAGGRLTIETASVRLGDEACRTQATLRPGDYVMLTVSDTGTGLTAEALGHLFEPFYTTKPHDRGAGLGLATVYGAVKQNNGTIDVRSEPGRGTTFTLYFPRVDVEPEETPAGSVPLVLKGTGTIVLVEDDGMVRAMAVRALRGQGYRVYDYPNGGEALMAINAYTKPLHLLITDVVMPGMNGRVLAQHVQSLRPHIKVLYTSGYTDSVIEHHGVLKKGIEFMQKPYTPELLTRRVREILDKSGRK